MRSGAARDSQEKSSRARETVQIAHIDIAYVVTRARARPRIRRLAHDCCMRCSRHRARALGLKSARSAPCKWPAAPPEMSVEWRKWLTSCCSTPKVPQQRNRSENVSKAGDAPHDDASRMAAGSITRQHGRRTCGRGGGGPQRAASMMRAHRAGGGRHFLGKTSSIFW